VLLAALRAHVSVRAVQIHACRALTAAIADSADGAARAVALGAVELAVAAMNAHLTDVDVQLAAFSALAALREVAEYPQRAAAAGAGAVAVAALFNLPAHAAVHTNVCSVFLLHASEAEARVAIDVGVLPALFVMLRTRTLLVDIALRVLCTLLLLSNRMTDVDQACCM
jgi:hypothetical protein